ncbi:hypothetical protein GYH30_018041 [Glycine max]|uniref:Uncharacterized protein n=1 Tax=Glycine max TaxID=3847 RepID=K7L1A9_SOYBN|nr:hypothetical protein GYH30_018041 [Glycine max]
MKEPTETSMSSSLARNPTTMIHPRHEAFEHNFLPILCLIFSNPTQTLIMLKHKLLELSSNQRADEKVHQLSYLQKHVANIVSLLAEPVEGEGKESLVC